MGNHRNHISNGGMEGTAAGNTLPSGWADTGSPDADETQTATADKHSGSASILLSAADANEGATQTVTVVSGKYYTFSYWEKNNAQDINVVLTGAATATLDTTGNNTWTKHSYTFKAASTTLVINLVSGAATQTGYFDDVALIELDQTAPTTATPSTATNSYSPGRWLDSDGGVCVDGRDSLVYPRVDNFNAAEGTLAFWANLQRPFNSVENTILFDVTGAGSNVIRLLYDASLDKFVYYIEAANRVLSATQTDNTNFYSWRHFAITWYYYPAENTWLFRLFMDGQLVDSYTSVLTAPTLTSNLFFGKLSESGVNAGDVLFDDIVIKNYSLTTSEVARLYESKLNLAGTSPDKGYYYLVGGRPGLYGGLSSLVEYAAKGNKAECSFVVHFITDFAAASAAKDYIILNWEVDGGTNYYRLYFEKATKKFVYERKTAGTSRKISSQAQNFSEGLLVDVEVAEKDGYAKILVNGVDQLTSATGDAYTALSSNPTKIYLFGIPTDVGAPITMLQVQAFIKALPVEELKKESIDWAAGDLAVNENATLSINDSLDGGDYYELDCDGETYEKYDASANERTNIYHLISGRTPSLLAEADGRTYCYLSTSAEGFKIRFRPHWL